MSPPRCVVITLCGETAGSISRNGCERCPFHRADNDAKGTRRVVRNIIISTRRRVTRSQRLRRQDVKDEYDTVSVDIGFGTVIKLLTN